jgi:hypothetical protein
MPIVERREPYAGADEWMAEHHADRSRASRVDGRKAASSSMPTSRAARHDQRIAERLGRRP